MTTMKLTPAQSLKLLNACKSANWQHTSDRSCCMVAGRVVMVKNGKVFVDAADKGELVEMVEMELESLDRLAIVSHAAAMKGKSMRDTLDAWAGKL